jgi:hypothetical protein
MPQRSFAAAQAMEAGDDGRTIYRDSTVGKQGLPLDIAARQPCSILARDQLFLLQLPNPLVPGAPDQRRS